MKRKTIIVLLMMAALTGLNACAGESVNSETAADSGAQENTETEASAEADSAGGSEIELSFAWWGNQVRNERTQAILH